jgi:manganese oxidase
MSRRTPLLWPALSATLALFLVVTVAVSYAGGSSPTTEVAEAGDAQADATPADATPAAAGTAVTEVDVDLTEFALDPATITVPAGSVVFRVTNSGALPHDLTLPDLDVATPELNGGDSYELRVDDLAPGEYRLLCAVPGHEAAGMAGTLVVTEAGAPVAAGTASGDDAGHGGHGDHGRMSAAEMAEKHLAGIAEYPQATAVMGNQPLEPVMDGDVKVFELTADYIDWETKQGVTKSGMAFNGQIPGPILEAELGDTIRIVLHNEMDDDPTAIHLHGIILPNAMDGVPGITQDPVMPGESFTYEVELVNAGSHMYHSHFDAAYQVPAGLLGALIVHDPERPVTEDVDYTMILNDGPLGFTINGKDFPATEPIVAGLGDTVRVRFMNEGLMIHPMHLHGYHMTVVEKDGYPLPMPYKLDTLNIAPGERYDVVIEADAPGVWAFHCHILNHVEAADGMFGMVTALIVQ